MHAFVYKAYLYCILLSLALFPLPLVIALRRIGTDIDEVRLPR